MSVYFLADVECGTIKIGYTGGDDPRKRTSTIQTASPHDLTLLGVIDGETDAEFAWHQRFDHLRLRGEWFRAGSDLVEAITSALGREICAEITDGLDRTRDAAPPNNRDDTDRWTTDVLALSKLRDALHAFTRGDSVGFAADCAKSVAYKRLVRLTDHQGSRCCWCFESGDHIALAQWFDAGAICCACLDEVSARVRKRQAEIDQRRMVESTAALRREFTRAWNEGRWIDAQSINAEIRKLEAAA